MQRRNITHTSTLFTTSLAIFALLGACAADTGGADLSKDEVQSLGDSAKADGVDFCESYGWYGDGECDTFCPLADQDCSDDACTVGADSTCAEGQRCAPGYCDFWCPPDASSCCEPASCQPVDTCTSDADCDDAAWCRETVDGGFACAEFALEGESCGGFTPPWAFEQCAPGLECDEPTDSDGPTDIGGVCVPAGPEDCRSAGCAAGEYCAYCWAGFSCIPDGAVC